MSKKILFIDSGVGGVSIINCLLDISPNLACIFVVDNANAPFGDKSCEYLCAQTERIIKYACNSYELGIIVLACNTLTVATIDYLRKIFSIPIIGTEPNIKTDKKAIALCTKYTAENCKLLKSKNNITILDMPQLASLIDSNLDDLDKVIPYLKRRLREYNDYKHIILGCTHYNLIKKQIKKALCNDNIIWCENRIGVAKRILQFIDSTYIIDKKEVEIILTKPNERFRQQISTYVL